MADINHIITLGIGTPGDIGYFITFGLGIGTPPVPGPLPTAQIVVVSPGMRGSAMVMSSDQQIITSGMLPVMPFTMARLPSAASGGMVVVPPIPLVRIFRWSIPLCSQWLWDRLLNIRGLIKRVTGR